MTVRLLAFTDRGYALAQTLAAALDGQAARCGAPLGLADWTAAAWRESPALVYVGAAGIAVRAIAPHVRCKAADPAVVVVDEAGTFAVSLLSGHLGGANDLTRRIAALCGAAPVITTATDARGLFAVDEWARRQNCRVQNPEAILPFSAKVLSGKTASIYSPWPISGQLPDHVALAAAEENCDALLTLRRKSGNALRLTPAIAVLGVGCRKGTPQTALEWAFAELLEDSGLSSLAFFKVCSIDLKREEPGLLSFCRNRGLALETFSARALRTAEGNFTASAFVQGVTGVDNVCERSAVLGSGGELLVKKQTGEGVTMAVALAPFSPDWRWRDE